MRLVFLTGRPAVGKLTVARRVAEATGYRLFHNHLVVDTALSLYDFGTPEFVALRRTLWDACFARMAADPTMGGVVFTFSPEQTVPQVWLDELFARFADGGHEVRVFELVCAEAEIEARIASASRATTGKLTDLHRFRQLRDAGTFDTPIVPGPVERVDTTHQAPEASAAAIVRALQP